MIKPTSPRSPLVCPVPQASPVSLHVPRCPRRGINHYLVCPPSLKRHYSLLCPVSAKRHYSLIINLNYLHEVKKITLIYKYLSFLECFLCACSWERRPAND